MAAPIEEILQLEQIDRDIYRGLPIPSKLVRTFGGQVAGQSLVSATRTVDPAYRVHSLHGYFLRPGKSDQPTVYLVDRPRDGRSFVTRRVDAVQHGETIFSMSASFQVPQDGLEHQDRMPPVPMPEELGLPDPASEDGLWEAEFEHFDVRIVPTDQVVTNPYAASQQRVWFKSKKALPDDPVFHVCTLAYMSDMTLLGSARPAHPDAEVQTASLDHAMWFLRPFRADEWLLYDQTSPSGGGARALTQGRIFTSDGRLVAAVVQEGLFRPLDPKLGQA
jgi:acyl-CoA thioesterase-2